MKLIRKTLASEEVNSFVEIASEDIYELLLKEAPSTFCKSHCFGSWPKIIKKTAILKSLHKEIYYEEIDKWESENDYSWGDFGFISGGVSLLQQ